MKIFKLVIIFIAIRKSFFKHKNRLKMSRMKRIGLITGGGDVGD
jgi:hypothetical protein